mmetsp:Transcript_13868/g.20468  ORF Transcript_13868/g.20468 Transcript_13868/m.20468 type:complete len:319 (-) Transcript_13868:258-1214(-)|eukprot:CAMPEP_0194221186 /NCGR_PEP_ID=MMETSP0156-20130528/30071_1 /TAXON_ID=33649 /ORGANISM="Thalassionema nitzschioides, Strain L26-B" /LENGTH=318 /DNA_ID=CAMNT_0038951501 /DNA_START=148 /DNA_END=1104 /DNA_ORIENTATION=-
MSSEEIRETSFETISDTILGLTFLGIALVSAKRMSWSTKQGGSETTVVTAFYSLILLTSSLRSIWFLVPNSVWEPSYTPTAVMAFDENYPAWIGSFLSEILLSAGSLALFSIFILILVYWADILKKYFYPGARRSRPMMTFATLVVALVLLEILNAALFVFGIYSTEGMILFNALLLSTVSLVCVVEITIFSHRFRTVLKTLGAINQVSTESQVKRIVWITVTGNLFFFTRAFLEAIFAFLLLSYWHQYGSVSMIFSHQLWDIYIILKHWSEVAILCLMLYILQSRFTAVAREGYEAVGESKPSKQGALSEEQQPLVV